MTHGISPPYLLTKKPLGVNGCIRRSLRQMELLIDFQGKVIHIGMQVGVWSRLKHTFALVAKMTTIRALLAVASVNDWMVVQMDVTNAFLHGSFNSMFYSLQLSWVLCYPDSLFCHGS